MSSKVRSTSRLQRRAVAALLGGTLGMTVIGCQAPVKLSLSQLAAPGAMLGAQPADPVGIHPLPPGTLPAGYGEVEIRVHWPERQVQRMPASANTLIIAIYDSMGAVVATTTLNRPIGPGADMVTDTTLTVPSTRHVTVWARAYREVAPNVATAVPVAVASGVGDVRDNAVLNLSLNMIYIPIIWAAHNPIVPDNGGPGATVALYGQQGFNGFVDPNNPTPSFQVQFTYDTVLEGNTPTFPTIASPGASTDLWVTSPAATRASDTLVYAQVPAGAVNGPVNYMVDGLSAYPPGTNSLPTFYVLKQLGLTPVPVSGQPAFPTWIGGGPYQFTCLATDSLGFPFVGPAVTWSSSQASIGAIDQTGLFTPLAVGVTTIGCSSGILSASEKVQVLSTWGTGSYLVVFPTSGFATVSGTVVLPGVATDAITGVASAQ